MDHSACIIVPVRNAQHVLSNRIRTLVDVLSASVDSFEIRIVDDASTDATTDEAEMLACMFPQVRLRQEPIQVGIFEAAEREIDRSDASFIVVHDIDQPLSSRSLQILWSMRSPVMSEHATRLRHTTSRGDSLRVIDGVSIERITAEKDNFHGYVQPRNEAQMDSAEPPTASAERSSLLSNFNSLSN